MAEAWPNPPDGPIYGIAPFGLVHISDVYDRECCSEESLRWASELAQVTPAVKDIAESNAFLMSISSSQYPNTGDMFAPEAFALQSQQPQTLLTSDLCTSYNGAFAQDSLSQLFSYSTNSSGLNSDPSSSWSTPLPCEPDDQCLASSSTSPPGLRSSPNAMVSPFSNGILHGPLPPGKREISATIGIFSCSSCKNKFTNEFLYRQHVRHRKCIAPLPVFVCDACGHDFKHKKDLMRHRTSTVSCSGSEPPHTRSFACTCNKSYPRKDSLQRHMNSQNKNSNSQSHNCKQCLRCRCICNKSAPPFIEQGTCR